MRVLVVQYNTTSVRAVRAVNKLINKKLFLATPIRDKHLAATTFIIGRHNYLIATPYEPLNTTLYSVVRQ